MANTGVNKDEESLFHSSHLMVTCLAPEFVLTRGALFGVPSSQIEFPSLTKVFSVNQGSIVGSSKLLQ